MTLLHWALVMEAEPSPSPLPAGLAAQAESRWQAISAAIREAGLPVPDSATLPGDWCRVLACSDYVAWQCERHPELLPDLLAADLDRGYGPGGAADELHFRAAAPVLAQRVAAVVTGAGNIDTLMDGLRRLRRREQVRIAWRDLGRLAPLEETVGDASALGDAAIAGALEWTQARARERYGTPTGSHSGHPQELVVFALGKLGAGELNFSSDVDLIFGYPESGATEGARRSIENQEFFERLGRQLIRVLNEVTAEGFVFRVDMRLRPFGGSGPLVFSFNALEDYYQSHGRDWERYALIRARPVAGDRAAGDALIERLRPFVYRRYLDFGALESLRSMKRLITEEVERRGLHGNVKLGPGGIREIEFTGQAFQMVRGGRIPELRDRSILRVLRHLGRLGYLPEYAVTQLADAYRFLRNSEHRLQQVDDRQVHELPANEAGRERLATGMGYADWESYATRLERHRRRVNAQFQQVFGPPEEPVEAGAETLQALLSTDGARDDPEAACLEAEGYSDPAAAHEAVRRFREAHAVRLLDQRARDRLVRLFPSVVRAAAGQADPEVTLARVLDIIEAIARRSAYLALLCERPLALSQLVRLCAASPWIARQIGRHPLLFDELLDPGSLYEPLGRAALEADLATRLRAVAGDTEQEMEALRQFKHANVLRVAAADVSRVLPLMVVSDHLTDIAEVALGQALALARRDLVARHGPPLAGVGEERREVEFAVVGYGKLGGLELGYASDLDIVFVHGSGGEDPRTEGPRPVDDAVFFGRLAQRTIHILGARTPEGPLYEVDSRLRPRGRAGLLVHSLEALEGYLREEAWTWEHQALVRARVVAGSPALAEAFGALRRRILLLARDPGRLRADVREMRERMRRELGTGDRPGFDPKQDPGGIADIEFMVQYCALRWGAELGPYLDYPDNIRLLEGIERAGLLSPSDSALLADAYRAYRARVHALALQEQAAILDDDVFEELRVGVARIWRALMEE